MRVAMSPGSVRAIAKHSVPTMSASATACSARRSSMRAQMRSAAVEEELEEEGMGDVRVVMRATPSR